ncbi:dihydrofolate reductase family protein [Catellatospora tritici]|uniref:dihydrofolate reductase family protein n=1 Tax=Catellatospora tritici TaxID=2851566 RepID=UPI001C2D7804|nr:dihydrofolate reductase family protein [Catellatospora tritici]MBV1852895.1 dihydrofolate reductase family protein [Catellatospora tritici]
MGTDAAATTAGKVVWHTTMSLDGFIAGPGDSMDWALRADLGPTEAGTAMIRDTGAILAGRRWYDMSLTRPDWAPYGGSWQGPVFVLTHRPPAPPPGSQVAFVSGEIRDAVATARTAAAGRDVVVFGPTVAQACLDADVLDEILVHVVPVLLGDGVRLFARPGADRPVQLQRTALAESGQLTDLRFEVTRR